MILCADGYAILLLSQHLPTEAVAPKGLIRMKSFILRTAGR